MTPPGFAGAGVVVTGVANPAQVGIVVARAFAARGAALELLDRDPAVHDRAAELRAEGFDAVGHAVDLTDAAALDALAADLRARRGRLAALAHVAGGFAMSGPVTESDPAVWHRQLGINLHSAYVTARALVPLLRGGGAAAFVASAAALPGAAVGNMSAYAVAKSGLVTLARALAQEEGAHGVRVNCIAPTAIRTGANVAAMGEGAAYVSREAVADTLCWLCAPDTRHVTGQVLELA